MDAAEVETKIGLLQARDQKSVFRSNLQAEAVRLEGLLEGTVQDSKNAVRLRSIMPPDTSDVIVTSCEPQYTEGGSVHGVIETRFHVPTIRQQLLDDEIDIDGDGNVIEPSR